MRLDGHPNVLEVPVDIVHLAEVCGSSLMQQQQLVEHVKHLRRRLMHAYHNCLLLQLRVTLQHLHQRYGRVAVQPRGGLLEKATETNRISLIVCLIKACRLHISYSCYIVCCFPLYRFLYRIPHPHFYSHQAALEADWSTVRMRYSHASSRRPTVPG